MEISIVKRDGSQEKFNVDKLITSIAQSGVPLEQSESIATKIQDWISTKASDGKITSNEIRDKIISELSELFPAEADSYQAFKK